LPDSIDDGAIGLVPLGRRPGARPTQLEAQRELMDVDVEKWSSQILPQIHSALKSLSGAGKRCIRNFARGRRAKQLEHRHEHRDAKLAEVRIEKLDDAKLWRSQNMKRLSTAVRKGSATSLLVGYDPDLAVDGVYSESQTLRVLCQAHVCYQYLQVIDERHFSVTAVNGLDVDGCAAVVASRSIYEVRTNVNIII